MTSQRDWLRLGPKGKQSGSGPPLWPDANTRTAGVQSGPKSFIVMVVEHGKAASLARPCGRANLTARRVGGSSVGMTEKAKASGNALDTPTSVWSDMARKYVEPTQTRKANDDRRQSVDASRTCCPKGAQFKRPHPVMSSGRKSQSHSAAGFPDRGKPLSGLSRMKGNFQVRVLRGGRAGNSPLPLGDIAPSRPAPN